MTHDELLASINNLTVVDGIFMKDALRAVVELHKPHEHIQEYGSGGLFCFACQLLYPCFTIQAIEKVLAHSTES